MCQSLSRRARKDWRVFANPRLYTGTQWTLWRIEHLLNSYSNCTLAHVYMQPHNSGSHPKTHKLKPKLISLWVHDKFRYGRKCLSSLHDFCLDDYIPKVHLWIRKEERPIWTGRTSSWMCSSSFCSELKIEEFVVDYCSSSFSVQNHTY